MSDMTPEETNAMEDLRTRGLQFQAHAANDVFILDKALEIFGESETKTIKDAQGIEGLKKALQRKGVKVPQIKTEPMDDESDIIDCTPDHEMQMKILRDQKETAIRQKQICKAQEEAETEQWEAEKAKMKRDSNRVRIKMEKKDFGKSDTTEPPAKKPRQDNKQAANTQSPSK